MREAKVRLDNLTKPKESLGRLEELAQKVVGITGKLTPKVKNKIVITMAADHGVAEEGVSAYPQEVTKQMVYNFIHGGAGINVLSNYIGAKVIVVDMGVKGELNISHPNFRVQKINQGTKNFLHEPAMSREQAVEAIERGMKVMEEEEEVDIVGVGDMGIGNTTSASAIIAVISGEEVEKVTGRGTGIDDVTFSRKVEIIEKALSLHQPKPEDPIDVLSKVGGFEIGGIAGVVLQACSRRIPVVIDGFISTAGALLASKIEPKVKHYLIASHLSQEVGHKIMLKELNLTPLLDLNLRLGEGTGAVLGMGLVEAGVRIYNEMATFEEAGVSRKNE
jgi:nicotinate-nucleotide--dimethylbenzimidazole phosphoribosyltransferase